MTEYKCGTCGSEHDKEDLDYYGNKHDAVPACPDCGSRDINKID